MSYEVFLVDDHPVVRQGYASIVERAEDLVVAGETASGEEALEEIPECAPDIVVVDVLLPGMNGIELIKRLEVERCDIPVLVISMHAETLYAERALEAGAMGYVMKNEGDTVIVEAIRAVLGGRIYVSKKMNAQMLMRSVGRCDDPSALACLSDRELEVFELLGQGLTTSQIADRMYISPKTVGSHRRQIQEKMDIATAAKLRQRAAVWTHLGETI